MKLTIANFILFLFVFLFYIHFYLFQLGQSSKSGPEEETSGKETISMIYAFVMQVSKNLNETHTLYLSVIEQVVRS